jgi:TRAP-type C4-dicarboxylate transport system permease small subunit
LFSLGRLLGRLTDLLAILACAAVVLMMLHITFDVVMRFIGYPIPATVTIVPHYYMLPIIFLPLALAERNNAHITVEILVQLLRRSWQRALAVLSWAVAAGVFSILLYQTWIDAVEKWRVGTFMMEVNWKIPIWASYFFLPAGFALVVAVLLYRIAVTLTGLRSGLGEASHDAFDDTLAGGE